MRSVADMSRHELEQALTDEIASARSEARPISRLSLSRLLQGRFPINAHDAEKLVDRYCDEKAPGVPTYLSSEFGTPYLKVLAIINIVIGVGLSVATAVNMTRGGHYLLWLAAALLFVIAAGVCWIQSVRPHKELSGQATRTQLSNMSFPNEAAGEPTSTGSLQSRS